MKIIGTVTATLPDMGSVRRSIPPLEVDSDAHIFEVEDRAVEETFPEEKYQRGWTFTVGAFNAACDICERPILVEETPALCTPCGGAARAHAAVDKAEQEWKEDGSP